MQHHVQNHHDTTLAPLQTHLNTFAIPRTADKPIQASRSNRKFLLLHMGPSKTGTTSIQRDSGEYPGFQKALEQDNTVYVGKFSANPQNTTRKFHDLMDCAATKNEKMGGCWNELLQKHSHRRLLHHSLVYSDEKMSYKGFNLEDTVRGLHHKLVVEQTKGIFRPFDEIIVVAAYRRYAEWLLSAYKEQNRNHCLKDPRRSKRKNHAQESQWPVKSQVHTKGNDKKGGSKCPNVWHDFMARFVKGKDHNTRVYKNIDHSLPALRAMQSQNHPTVHVHVLDFHSTDYNSVTTTLYCQILNATADGTYTSTSRTPYTCHYSMYRPEAPIYHQGSVAPTAYDDIVVAAALRYDLINTTQQTRFEARTALEYYHTQPLRKSFVDLPLLCPSKDELQTLLSKSLDFEAQMMGNEYAMRHRDEHVAKFWKSALEKKEYCWVDTERLLKGTSTWQQVLDERLTKSWND
jgi:hypothetical protein